MPNWWEPDPWQSGRRQNVIRETIAAIERGEYTLEDVFAGTGARGPMGPDPGLGQHIYEYKPPGWHRSWGADYDYTIQIMAMDLSPEDRDFFLRNRGPDVSLTEQVNQARRAQDWWRGQQQTTEQAATAQTNLDTFLAEQEDYERRRLKGIDIYAQEGEAGIAKVEAEGLGNYEREIGRLTGFIANPSSMRSDAQVAGQLKAVEDAISGEIAEVRAGAAKTLAQSGLRAAGKVETGVRQAEQLGTYKAGQNISNILGQAGSARTALGEQKVNFMGGIEDARRALTGDVEQRRGAVGGEILGGGYAARSNALSTLSGLTRQAQGIQPPDLFSATGTQYDIQGLQKGWGAMDDASRLAWANLILGGIQTGIGQAGQFVSSMRGGGG